MSTIAVIWRSFASLRTSLVLGLALAGLVLASVWLPQGWMAIEQLGADPSASLRLSHRLGLTDLAGSPVFWAVVVLLVGNGLGLAIMAWARARVRQRSYGQQRAVFSTSRPDTAARQVKASLSGAFGTAAREAVDGATVELEFDTAPRAAYMPLILHAGLVLLMVGGVLASSPPSRTDTVVRATFIAKDSDSNALGYFDVAQREERNFFFHPDIYMLEGYSPNAQGLGPAVRLVRFDPKGSSQERFWVYQKAPPGFDARHRRGQVALTAVSMGYTPRPGYGLTSKPESVVALLGLGLLFLSILDVGRPRGSIRARVQGREVVLEGGSVSDPKRFERFFPMVARLVQSTLEDPIRP